MGATEEQIAVLSALHVTHVSYILLIFSAAFLLFLFVCVLLHIYAQATWPLSEDGLKVDTSNIDGRVNSGGGIKLPVTPVNGHLPKGRKDGKRDLDLERAKFVEEFELEGLIGASDEEVDDVGEGSSNGGSEDSGSGRRKEGVKT